jgi:hypothetical protein
MGLFDKLKQVKNFVTGGGAELTIVAAEEVFNGNEPLRFKLQCQVKDAELSVNNIYFKIRATEEVVAEEIEVEMEDGELEVEKERVRQKVITYQDELVVDGEQTLEANELYEWDVEVELPVEEVNGTYRGRNCVHEWEVYAGLDIAGNDPDSNWQNITIRI